MRSFGIALFIFLLSLFALAGCQRTDPASELVKPSEEKPTFAWIFKVP